MIANGESRLGELCLVVRDKCIRVTGPGDSSQSAPSEPEAFRRYIRFDQRGRYRALSGAIGLRRDWFVDCASMVEAADLIEIVYPLALRHCAQQREGRLRVVDAGTVLNRQTSRYAEAGALGREDCDQAVEALCDLCVRQPCWAGVEGEGIPCPEPCSVFVALAQGVAEWGEADRTAPMDPDAGFADFDLPGNEVRCRFLFPRPNSI